MHMADALLSPQVAGVMYAASAVTAGVSIFKLKKEEKLSEEPTYKKLPTMAVMAALVFAGQMINYAIPGTGSSGHLCGGMMLTALLGPYAGFLSMIVILAIQCLFFADGGLLALGANIWNMAFYGCFVGYFLIYRPIMRSKMMSSSGKAANRVKIILASMLGCVITLQLGAFSVVLETSLSGITELPFGSFLMLMQPIHLAIGAVEGLITSAILIFVCETRPSLLKDINITDEQRSKGSVKAVLITIAAVALIVGGGISLLASGNPDGLEWALFGNSESGYSENMGLDEENFGVESKAAERAEKIQNKTSFLPDYAFSSDSENPAGTSVSGIVGSAMVAIAAAAVCFAGGFFRKRAAKKKESN